MRGILIDPASKAVTVVDATGEREDIYSLLACTTIEGIALVMGEILYVDEEGMMAAEPGPFFALDGIDEPLAGRGLVLGLDVYGKHHNSHMQVADVLDMISWPDIEIVGFEETSNANEIGHRPIFRKKEQH